MKTAILVDGGFYRRRAQIMIGDKTAEERAKELENYCRRHLIEKHQPPHELYRIFYYDCPPMLFWIKIIRNHLLLLQSFLLHQ